MNYHLQHHSYKRCCLGRFFPWISSGGVYPSDLASTGAVNIVCLDLLGGISKEKPQSTILASNDSVRRTFWLINKVNDISNDMHSISHSNYMYTVSLRFHILMD